MSPQSEQVDQRDQAEEQRRESIRSFLLVRFAGKSIADDEDIFDRGFVNSLFALELVMHLERAFQVRLPNEVLRLDNFRTVAAMSATIEKLTQDADAAGGERR
ncbi:MAG: acyl carrier protein [Pseudonocardiaceae bacterium]